MGNRVGGFGGGGGYKPPKPGFPGSYGGGFGKPPKQPKPPKVTMPLPPRGPAPSTAPTEGNTDPTPSGPGAPPPVPGQATPTIDWNALITADPNYVLKHGQILGQIDDSYTQYGMRPDANGVYQALPGNDYSTVSQLAKQLKQQIGGHMQQANNSGALYSGAAATQYGLDQQANDRASFAARQALIGRIGGLQGDDSGLYLATGDRLKAQAGESGTPAAPAAAAPTPGLPPAAPGAPAPAQQNEIDQLGMQRLTEVKGGDPGRGIAVLQSYLARHPNASQNVTRAINAQITAFKSRGH